MLRPAFSSGLIAFGLLAAPVEAQSSPDAIAMAEAIEILGCVVNTDNEASILTLSGLDGTRATVAAQELFQAGQLVQDDAGLRLTTGSCAGAAAAPALPDGVAEAVAWLSAQDDAAAGGYLADRLAAAGCALENDQFNAFFEDFTRRVAAEFGMDLPEMLPADDDPTFGTLMRAIDDFGNRGGGYLRNTGQLDNSNPNRSVLVGCGAGATLVAGDGAPSPGEVFNRLLELDRAMMRSLLDEVHRRLGCSFPVDYGIAAQAYALDLAMQEFGLPLGPDVAMEVMAALRMQRPIAGDYARALEYMATVIEEASVIAIQEDRWQIRGRMLVDTQCVPADAPVDLYPYLTGGP